MKKVLNKLPVLVATLVMIVGVTSLASCTRGSSSSSSSSSTSSSSQSSGWTNEQLLDLTVRDYTAENGVVAAANPFAAYAGLQMLEAGGNAFDAAVAVSFALGVTELYASGIGGGGVMTAYNATTGEYIAYNFREFVPAAGTPAAYGYSDGALDDGILGSGVPTQVAGLLGILESEGTLTRQQVIAPAIDYAENGVVVTPELANAIRNQPSRWQGQLDFTRNGISAVRAGDTLKQPEYANTLKAISENGSDGFYKGWVAEAILQAQSTNYTCVKAGIYGDEEYVAGSYINQEVYDTLSATEKTAFKSGLITQADLDYAAANYPIKETPITGNYTTSNGERFDIASATTPSSGGIILVETLNMLEHYNSLAAEGKKLSELGHNSGEYLHVIGKAMSLAYSDKSAYIADSRKVDVPIDALTNKAFAAERWDLIEEQVNGGVYCAPSWSSARAPSSLINKYHKTSTIEAASSNDSGNECHDTTAFSVADKNGNIVSVTQTINHFFGNGVVPKGTGFFLNNQLSSFYADTSSHSGSVHFVEPYKQPVSHIMPTIIMKDGDPWATLGSPGSMRIPSAVIQVALNLMEFGMDMQTAIASPRGFNYGTSTAEANNGTKTYEVELGIPEESRTYLANLGYDVSTSSSGGKEINLYFGGVHGIRFDITNGTMHGGADPRRDGKAVGY